MCIIIRMGSHCSLSTVCLNRMRSRRTQAFGLLDPLCKKLRNVLPILLFSYMCSSISEEKIALMELVSSFIPYSPLPYRTSTKDLPPIAALLLEYSFDEMLYVKTKHRSLYMPQLIKMMGVARGKPLACSIQRISFGETLGMKPAHRHAVLGRQRIALSSSGWSR